MTHPHHTPITIQRGLPETQRHRAAELYYDAFRQKLEPIIGDTEVAVRLLAEGLVPERAMVAIANGEVIGVVGLHIGDSHFADIRPSALIREFGWWVGTGRILRATVLGSTPADDEILIDGIAVNFTYRGQGIGTQLLKEVFAYAREKGFRLVRLEVVDTNPDAQRLYERMGFEATNIRNTGIFTQKFGFRAVTTMIKMV